MFCMAWARRLRPAGRFGAPPLPALGRVAERARGACRRASADPRLSRRLPRRAACSARGAASLMASHVVLTADDHRSLRIDTGRGAELGDAVMSCLVVPNEFRRVQSEYPILFHRTPERDRFQALAMFGFEHGENLFLDWRPLGCGLSPARDGDPAVPDRPSRTRGRRQADPSRPRQSAHRARRRRGAGVRRSRPRDPVSRGDRRPASASSTPAGRRSTASSRR